MKKEMRYNNLKHYVIVSYAIFKTMIAFIKQLLMQLRMRWNG